MVERQGWCGSVFSRATVLLGMAFGGEAGGIVIVGDDGWLDGWDG